MRENRKINITVTPASILVSILLCNEDMLMNYIKAHLSFVMMKMFLWLPVMGTEENKYMMCSFYPKEIGYS